MSTTDPLAPSRASASPEQRAACPTCQQIIDASGLHDGDDMMCGNCGAELVYVDEEGREAAKRRHAEEVAAALREAVNDLPRMLDRDSREQARAGAAKAFARGRMLHQSTQMAALVVKLCDAVDHLQGDAPAAPPDQAPAELTPDRLDEFDRRAREAAERASKATDGPWFREEAQDGEMLPDGTGYAGDYYPTKTVLTVAGNDRHEAEIADAYRSLDDALFIAAAREDVPALSAALQSATAEIRRLRGREARLVHERECLGTAIADAAYKAGISNGMPMTGPELILMAQEMADAIRRGQERVERIEAEHCRRHLLGEMAVADVVDGLLEEEA
ncbi:hypothetical protein WMF38_57020 [Sorangium sp. So ce118]